MIAGTVSKAWRCAGSRVSASPTALREAAELLTELSEEEWLDEEEEEEVEVEVEAEVEGRRRHQPQKQQEYGSCRLRQLQQLLE